MARVRFEHVTKRFADVEAVHDFNLEVVDGEFLVLVGPSGCGKSTTLRMLAGLDDVTEGEIYIGDRRVDQVPAKDRDIAMVFQTYALYPHMTVGDNMAFGLKLRKVKKDQIRPRVAEAARILGIEELLDRKPGQLSGGQRQRVALGRAIVREPAVFLLDEPLSNLDAKLRVQTRTELSRLHLRLGTTFVYVTHDQVEAMTMADRIAVMNVGVLQQVGSPQDLYERPVNRFVAGFIGSPEMNFLEATVRREGESLQLDFGGGTRIVPQAEDVAGLAPYEGKPVVIGIRPEHIHDRDHVPRTVDPAPVEAQVDVLERMGNETFLHLKHGDTPLLARVDPHTTAEPDQTVQVVFDASELYAFDPDTDASIPLGMQP
jgi:multiple sugar transport system ATP-binding protein